MSTINEFPIQALETTDMSATEAVSLIKGSLQETPSDTAYCFQGKQALPVYGSTGVLRLQWSSDPVQPPAVGFVSSDSNTFATMTQLKINKLTKSGADISFILKKKRKGSTIFLSVDQKTGSFVGVTLTGDAVESSTYYTLPVKVETVGTDALSGDFLLFNESATDEPLNVVYCDYTLDPSTPIPLTTTPTLVSNWIANIPAKGITESGGRFTVDIAGVDQSLLERIYENIDRNPRDKVYVTIDIRKNGRSGDFTRTLPIASATARDEPSIDTYTTPFITELKQGDYFEIYVSGTDSGSNPRGTSLIQMSLVTHLIQNSSA